MSQPGSSKLALIANPGIDDDGPFGAGRDNLATPAERSYQKLANGIAKLISEGELAAGDRLPSERILADRYNVSRTSVREAIIALEIRELVEVRAGSGIYVRAMNASSMRAETATGPIELLRGRLIIEPEICAAAAANAKHADLDAAHATLVTLRETVADKRAYDIADRAFHFAIASATGNAMLAQIVAGIWDRRRGAMWEKFEEHFHTPTLREGLNDDHQSIFKAVFDGNPEEARDQMRGHIERVIREFKKAW